MINPSEDKEIEKMKLLKIAAMLERAKAEANQPKKPIIITDANFSAEVGKHKLMLVDFWAPWCGPCRMVGPVLEQLAEEYAGKVTFGKINVDENRMVPGHFGVQSIPTMIIFKDGHPVDTIVGACSKSQLESKLRPYMGY